MKKEKIKLLYVGDYWYNTAGKRCHVFETKKSMQLSGKIRIHTSGNTYTYAVDKVLECINEDIYTGFTRNKGQKWLRANMLLKNAVALKYELESAVAFKNEIIRIDNSINNSITINTINNEQTRKITTDSGSKEIPTAIKSNSTRKITIASPLVGNSIQGKRIRTAFREFKILKVSISC